MATLKLLIIEDDVDQRELLSETLQDHFGKGSVTAVGTRAEALQQDLQSFDLILTDHNLPDCLGIELLAEIKQRCNTPVIMVTGENVGQIAVEAIRRGATDYVVKTGDYIFTVPLVVEKNLTVAKVKRENESLRQELERALTDVKDKNSQLEHSLEKVEELAATDALTGLYNRRQFARLLEQMFAEAQRLNTELSCVMIDMDGFKQVNDTLGHQVGDQLIITAGKVINANMRRMDVAARYGGDEFVLLIPHTSPEDAVLVLQRIREEFKNTSKAMLKKDHRVTMSAGIASLKQLNPPNADTLVAAADQALYRAKQAGRDRIIGAEKSPVRAA